MRTVRDRSSESAGPPAGSGEDLDSERLAGSHSPSSQDETRRASLSVVLGVLGIAVLLSMTLAITIGPVYISPVTVWHIIASHVLGVSAGDWTAGQDHIVWLIRLPRVAFGRHCGGGARRGRRNHAGHGAQPPG